MRKSNNLLTPHQVYRYAVQLFQPHLKLANARNVAVETILTVLFAAAARISSLSDTCQRLLGVPDEHALAEALYSTLPDYNKLRRRVQDALLGLVPKALRRSAQGIAIDLTLLPYYGADRRTNPQIYRGQSKKGTNSFYAYATAYVICKGMRYTLALMAVVRSTTMEQVVRELLKQVRASGVKIGYTVLDKGFYSVEVIGYLQRARVPFLMPMVCRGRSAKHPLGPSGSYLLKQRTSGGWDTYTMKDRKKKNSATVQVCIKCRNLRGQRGKRGRDARLYAYWGINPGRIEWVVQAYRSRFGIETSYRQMNQCRIRTTSKKFNVRFLYAAIGFLLRNLWVWLHYAVLSKPRRGTRELRLARLRLRTMLLWLFEVARQTYGLAETAATERPLPYVIVP